MLSWEMVSLEHDWTLEQFIVNFPLYTVFLLRVSLYLNYMAHLAAVPSLLAL